MYFRQFVDICLTKNSQHFVSICLTQYEWNSRLLIYIHSKFYTAPFTLGLNITAKSLESFLF